MKAKLANTYCMLLFLILVASASFAQEIKKTDTNKTTQIDTINIKNRINNLGDVQSKVDQLNKDLIKVQKENGAYLKSIDSLKKFKESNQAVNKQLLLIGNKLKSNIKKYNLANEELQKQNKAFQDTLKNLKADVQALANSKEKFKKETDQLKKDSSTLKKSVDDLNEKEKTYSKQLETTMATIAKQLDSLEVIATIEMYDYVVVHGGDGKAFKTKINSVHVTVKEGVMLEVVVVTDSGTFRNKAAIIDLLHFGSRGKDKLQYENRKWRRDGSRLFIYLDDVIDYSPIKSYSDLPYSDFDITLTPKAESRKFLLKESTSINTYFNISAFTDIKGISGEPNGLAQFSAESKWITNTQNFKNTAVIPFNYISFFGTLAKYDTKFKGTQIFHHDSVSRRDLFQRSTYEVGVKVNLLRGFPSPYPHHLFNDLQLNIGYNFIGTQVYDTTFKDKAKTIIDTSFRTVTQNHWYIEPSVTINRHKNFSMTLSIPFHMIGIKENAMIKNFHQEYWASPSIDLMYYGKKDSGSKLFFRYHQFVNLKDHSQGFSQIQLGYSVSFSNAFAQK